MDGVDAEIDSGSAIIVSQELCGGTMGGLPLQNSSSVVSLQSQKDQGSATVAPASDSKPKKKICCACPDTKKLRDECIVEHGETACEKWIEAHRRCLRAEGFNSLPLQKRQLSCKCFFYCYKIEGKYRYLADDQGSATVAPASDSKPKKKICCACPDTKKLRDECIVEHGETACEKWIEAHRRCLRAEGFNV
ncbi:Cytochrome [Forsythia ovata]|uniref:Cytochrome n=1 Tax=Forsythia ovata TaxID=205694 RepID=A0ABD1Q939_9LAMI